VRQGHVGARGRICQMGGPGKAQSRKRMHRGFRAECHLESMFAKLGSFTWFRAVSDSGGGGNRVFDDSYYMTDTEKRGDHQTNFLG